MPIEKQSLAEKLSKMPDTLSRYNRPQPIFDRFDSSMGITRLWPLLLILLIGGMFIAGYRLVNISRSTNITILQSSELRVFGSSRNDNHPKVLLVHSYHPGYEWVASLSFGVKKALSGSGAQLETFYMDTKRNTDEEWKVAMGKKALDIVQDWKPDVVITADDNAQAYFGKHLAGMRSPSVVFCGVNRPVETYNYPKPNVTGVIEKPHLLETIDFFTRLVPQSDTFLFLSDNSPTSMGVVQQIQQDPKLTSFQISFALPSTFEEWQAAVKQNGDKVDAIAVYTYHTLKNTESEVEQITPEQVLQWTISNSKVPVIGFLSFAIDAGALGGVVESGSEHGFKAGQMALKILKGTPASDIPIGVVQEGKTMFNFESAERFDIAIPSRDLIESNAVITGW